MKYSYVEEEITEDLTKILNPLGFKYRKSKNTREFMRITDYGYNSISVVISNYAPEFDIDLSFSIRINEVQERLNEFSLYDDLGKKEGETVNTRLAYFINEDLGYIFEVTSEKELQEVRDKIKTIISDKGEKYFKNFSDLSRLDIELNANPKEHSAHMFALPNKAFKATIIAKLNNNPDFENIVSTYANELRERNVAHLERYNAMLSFLRK